MPFCYSKCLEYKKKFVHLIFFGLKNIAIQTHLTQIVISVSSFFLIKFLLPPANIKQKETKLVLFSTIPTHLPLTVLQKKILFFIYFYLSLIV